MITLGASSLPEGDHLSVLPGDASPSLRETLIRVVRGLREAGIASCIIDDPDRMLDESGEALIAARSKPELLARALAPLDPIQIAHVHTGVLLFSIPTGDIFLHLQILYRDLTWRGAALIPLSAILDSATERRGLRIAADRYRGTVPWMLRLAAGTKITRRDVMLAHHAMLNDSVSLGSDLRGLFGTQGAEQIEQRLRVGNLDLPYSIAIELLRQAWRRSARRHPFGTVAGVTSSTRSELNRWFEPAGIDVAILGADGVGKTSVCHTLASFPASRMPFQRITWAHLYQRVLPPLGTIARVVKRRRAPASGEPVFTPGTRPAPLGFWMMAYSYYIIDMWLGHWLKSQRQLAKTTLVLHDRHSLEVQLDLKRYRYRGPARIANWMAKRTPQPELVIVLDAPDEVVHARKPNTPLEETQRRLTIYREFARRTPGTTVINTSQPLEDVVRQVRDIITSTVAARTRTRYGLQETGAPQPAPAQDARPLRLVTMHHAAERLPTPDAGTVAAAMQTTVDAIGERLDRAGIPWCLLRNRHQIPWGLTKWSDLDMIVPAEADSERLVDVLADLQPGQIVNVRPGVVTFSFPVLNRFLRVDICYGDLDWRGAPFAYADEILAERWSDDGIMVASRLHQAYVTWVSKLVWSGFYSTTYTDAITSAWREEPERMHALLKRSFGQDLADRLVTMIRDGNLVESEALVNQLRQQLWRRSLRRRPARQIGASVAQLTSRVRTLIQPPGLTVALIRNDAAAQLPVVQQLQQAGSRQMPCGRIDHLTTDQRTLPDLPALSTEAATRSTLAYTYQAIDAWISHLRWTRYRLTRGRLVIDERPFLALSLDASKDRSWLGRRWRRLLEPRADLVIALETHALAGTTLAGRQDVHRVDTDQSLDDIAGQIRDIVTSAYATRTRRRFRKLAP
jgi:hypothetical protein